mgnify:CR=1 FL=1
MSRRTGRWWCWALASVLVGLTVPSVCVGIKATDQTGPPEPVPEGVIMAMKLYIADFYEHRTAQVFGSSRSENMAAAALLNPYRVEMGV